MIGSAEVEIRLHRAPGSRLMLWLAGRLYSHRLARFAVERLMRLEMREGRRWVPLGPLSWDDLWAAEQEGEDAWGT